MSKISFEDDATIDAFGRLRVSQPHNNFDSQFNYTLNPLFWVEDNTGSGAISHQANTSEVRLTTGGTTVNDEAIFQSKRYFRYQPGKSDIVVFTCVLGAKKSNVRQRIGLFDDDNGLFFEQDESDLKVVVRSKTSGSVVDNTIIQSNWNLDQLDGTGMSGLTLDTEKNNIFVIDYQWLGIGRVRFGFDLGGEIVYCHEIKHPNTLTVPYMATGNLPFRVAVKNIGTSVSSTDLSFFCMVIASEAGFNPLGVPLSAQNTSLREVTTVNDPLPILSIRPRATFNSITNRGHMVPKAFSIISEDATIRYEIILNGSLTGASFADVNTVNSIAQVDTSATAISGGIVIDSGFLSGAKDKQVSGTESAVEEFMNKLGLFNDKAGTTTDILTIAISIINSAGTESDCAGAFTWKELY